MPDRTPISRRALLASVASAVTSYPSSAQTPLSKPPDHFDNQTDNFLQPGITTHRQRYLNALSFDLLTDDRHRLTSLLKQLTGLTYAIHGHDKSHEVQAGSTMTIGFGPTLFGYPRNDRFGPATRIPAELHPLPQFVNDKLLQSLSDGDILVQLCSDDRGLLTRFTATVIEIVEPFGQLRWAQSGFIPESTIEEIPRTVIGFQDGILNPTGNAIRTGPESPQWMRGGTYLTFRRIEVDMVRWNSLSSSQQEQAMGRHKRSGAEHP
jgi:Dyp-type peroxidase family